MTGKILRPSRNRRVAAKKTAPRNFWPQVKRLSRYVMALTAFAGLVVGVSYGWLAIQRSGRLKVREVVTVGGIRTNPDEVAAYSGIRPSDGILDIDVDAAALQLLRHPWIEKATVRRSFPDRVVITIQEFEPTLLVSLGELYLANAEGKLFKRLGKEDAVNAPVLTGLSRDIVQQDPTEAARKIHDASKTATALALYHQVFGRLEELNLSDAMGTTAIFRENRMGVLKVYLGHNPTGRIEAARQAVVQARQVGKRPTVVWASGEKHPERVHVECEAEAVASSMALIAKAR